MRGRGKGRKEEIVCDDIDIFPDSSLSDGQASGARENGGRLGRRAASIPHSGKIPPEFRKFRRIDEAIEASKRSGWRAGSVNENGRQKSISYVCSLALKINIHNIKPISWPLISKFN